MTRKDVERAERFFAGRGAWSVAVARVIPLVRAFAGLVAGFMEVPALPFEIFNLIGTVVWATALSVLGYQFGSDWGKVSKNFSHASDALVVLVVLVLVGAHRSQGVRDPEGAQGRRRARPAPRTDRTAPVLAGHRHRARYGQQGWLTQPTALAPHRCRLPGLPAQLRRRQRRRHRRPGWSAGPSAVPARSSASTRSGSLPGTSRRWPTAATTWPTTGTSTRCSAPSPRPRR